MGHNLKQKAKSTAQSDQTQKYDSDEDFISLAYQDPNARVKPIKVEPPIKKSKKGGQNVHQVVPIGHDLSPPPPGSLPLMTNAMPPAIAAYPPNMIVLVIW